MSEQNERQMEILRVGAKIFNDDIERLTDRHALVCADESLLLE